MFYHLTHSRIYILVILIGLTIALFSSVYAEEITHPIDSEEALCMEGDNTTASIVQCSNEAERKWDKELNRIYKLLLQQLDAKGQGSLQNSQAQWIQHRDAEFQAFRDIYGTLNGSMWQTVIASSRAELVKARVLALQNYLDVFEVNRVDIPLSYSSVEVNSLCTDSERIIFNCQVSKKTLSLCASQNISKKSGYLYYRFGSPNAIEMQLPESSENSLESFVFARKKNVINLSVKHSKYTMQNAEPVIYSTIYQVYSYSHSEDNENKTAGVLVILPSGKKNDFTCTSQIIDNLLDIEGIVPTQ